MLYAENSSSQYYPALGIGIAYPQQQPASGLTFGNPATYGVSFTQQGGLTGAENDGTGQMTASASGANGTLTGVIDEFANIGLPSLALSDTFTLPADNFGRGNVPGAAATQHVAGDRVLLCGSDQRILCGNGSCFELYLGKSARGNVWLFRSL